MARHYGSLLTVFQARTTSGAHVGNGIPWIWPLTVMMFPWSPVMLATLNFTTTGDGAWTCPMCTYQDLCFLCSDDLEWWLEPNGNLQARRRMGVHPIPRFEVLCLQCEDTGHWQGTDGMAAWNTGIEASAELFNTSDVHELLAFYDQGDQGQRQAKGETSKEEEDEEDVVIHIDACPSPGTDSRSSLGDCPHDAYGQE